MGSNDTPNAEAIEYWNDDAGPRWARHAPAIDAQLAPFIDPLIERSAMAEGQRVLDVGCGAGALTRVLSGKVGATGSVVGVDISETLLDVARARCVGEAIEFRCADAQVEAFENGEFDRIFSRFGVMFFQDSVAAFRNLRRALGPQGSLAIVCWASREDNPWMGIPGSVLARHVEIPEPPDPDAPGPFRFRDPAFLRELCGQAGFAEVTIDPLRGSAPLGGRGSFDQALDFMMEIGPAAQAKNASDEVRQSIRTDLGETLRPYATEQGIELQYAAWHVQAR